MCHLWGVGAEGVGISRLLLLNIIFVRFCYVYVVIDRLFGRVF